MGIVARQVPRVVEPLVHYWLDVGPREPQVRLGKVSNLQPRVSTHK